MKKTKIKNNNSYSGVIKHNKMTKEEENILFKQSKEGNKNARETLVKNNVFLVTSLVSKLAYIPIQTDTEEIIQDAIILLIESIDKFDYTKNNKFSTYYYHAFYNRIYEKLEEYKNIGVHIPKYIKQLKEKHLENLKNISEKELEIYLRENKISQETYRGIMNLGLGYIYIDKLAEESKEQSELVDPFNIETNYIEKTKRENIEEILSKSHLTEEELYILLEKNGFIDEIPKTNKYLAKKVCKSTEWVRTTYLETLLKVAASYPTELFEFADITVDAAKKHLQKIKTRTSLSNCNKNIIIEKISK